MDQETKEKMTEQVQGGEGGFHLSSRSMNIFITLLCAFAGFRIFFYSAAFPVFNNVDEQAHFDVVYKYAGGHIPDKLKPFNSETADLVVTYASPEYLRSPDDFPERTIPLPPWSLKADSASYQFFKIFKERATKDLQTQLNIESTQPPVYYLVAALWHKLGKVFGLSEGSELYWIRFLNVPVYVLLIWLSFFFLKRLFPDNAYLLFGVPLFLSVFPQSILFGMNNDVLSPLMFSLAFFCLIEIYLSEEKTRTFYLLTGLFVALTFLTKISNQAIIVTFAVILALKIRQRKAHEGIQADWVKSDIIILSATLPIAFWFGRNYFVLSDITGSEEKIQHLGWTIKPFSEMWNHPFFSIKGAITFWHDLLATFWRGEFVWHKAVIASSALDAFYSISSFIFIGFVIASILFTRKERSKERFVHSLSLLVIAVSISFLLVISLAFDFHNCWYPSRNHPFMTSGRLIFGMIVPFLILYLGGIRYVLDKLRLQSMREAFLLLIAITMTASEFIISYPVFKSSYNWFHIIGFMR